MKKLFLKVMAIALIATSTVFMFSCKGKDDYTKQFEQNIFADSYIDYAKECFMDVEKYPDMAEMGLFWVKEVDGKMVEVPADSEDGAAIVDVNKPTIINVHGMLTDGYLRQEHYVCPLSKAHGSDIGQATEELNMLKLWRDKGYNVGAFHYNRFATNLTPSEIETKLWSAKGKSNVSIKHADGSVSDNVSKYCVAEIFAAEYLRAVNLLPKDFGKSEIRVASHSMGGVLTAPTLFLLTELSRVGQVDFDKLPDRYVMLDTYFSVFSPLGEYAGPKDILINWSDKPLIKNNCADTILECLKVLDNRGIELEYYTNKLSFLNATINKRCNETLKTLCAYTYVSKEYNHNGIREWYLLSILNKDIKTEDGAISPSASVSIEDMKALKGKMFEQTKGNETYLTNDDVFKQIS